MTEQTVPPPESIESTGDDRLWALLAYLFTPFEIPVVTNFVKGQGWA